MTAGHTITASCEIGSCDGKATGQVTDYDGKDRNYCDKHTQQMGNLAGWSRKSSTKRTSSLMAQFMQWCRTTGIAPTDPSALSGFASIAGVDVSALAPMVQQIGLQGPGGLPTMPTPNSHGSEDLSGLSDKDLTLSQGAR